MEQVHFEGSVPEAYLKYLQPLLFDPFSAPFASRVCASSPTRVLELACGTGALTGELAERCLGEIVATDLQAAMIKVAKREFWHLCGVREEVIFEVADAQNLPYTDATFDAIACQFGYMFFPDKPRALTEARRVLVKGGSLHFLVWESLEVNDVARIAHDVLVPFLPEGTPRPFAGPFGFYDTETLSTLLNEAGFTQINYEHLWMVEDLPDPEVAARAFCRGTPISQDLGERTGEAEQTLAQVYAKHFELMEDHSLYALYVKAS